MPLCREYLKGHCRNGPKCRYLHDPCRKNRALCKAFIRGYCVRVGRRTDGRVKGAKCRKIHSPSDRLVWLKQKMVEVGE